MIQIDIPMPTCCYQCKMVGVEAGTYTCHLTSAHPEDTELRIKRPDWCPLKEVGKDSESKGNTAIDTVNGDVVIQKGQINKHIINYGTMSMTIGR